ncbi:hypothetical protein ACFZB4_17990 [Streptomyces pseudovenezuelae]|uniref:hypothetical protein n=1 Tax=Streptomyces pseudovenezuelae TaxID=67350 RepID=UPI0036ED7230
MSRPSGTAVGACAVLLLASLTACGSTTPDPSLTVPGLYYLRPYGDRAGPKDKTPFHVSAEDGNRPGVRRLTVEVAPDGRDVVRLKKYGPCEGDSARLTCEVDGDYSNWADNARAQPHAVRGARAGATAVVRYTYTTLDGRKLTARTRFVVGEPVVEAVAPEYAKELLRPGSELVSPLVVRNTGEVPVRGLGIAMTTDGTQFTRRYGNCRYPELRQGHLAVCELPEVTIDPGETLTVRPALTLRVPTAQMHPSYGRDVWALDMGPGQYRAYPRGGGTGDGPALEAEPTTAAEGAFAGGGGSTRLTVDTHADYQVSAVALHGAPGTRRTFRIEVRNNGPADAGTATDLVFEPPLELRVVKEPVEEYDDGAYRAYCDNNGFTYTCAVPDLRPGETRSFEFTAELGAPGRGVLSLQEKDPAGPWDGSRRDPDPSNDEAAIRVVP